LISGRKLLLADDSAAVQKVVELTFGDEGMEVFSVGDGNAAWEKLAQFTPDVVLADAFMPGLSGYELCRSIKDDNRFAQIPVMLLVSSFAPYDEAEAQRVGADAIMTKPFQSIRQLVSRVESLVSSQRPAPIDLTGESTPTLEHAPVLAPVEVDAEPQVTVLVEAAQMETAASPDEPGGTCAPDIEFQTADTARLEATAKTTPDSEDTIEMEPQFDGAGPNAGSSNAAAPGQSREINNAPTMTEVSPPERIQPRFTDSLLDLDEAEFRSSSINDDVVLDLDLDESRDAIGEDQSWNFAAAPEAEPPSSPAPSYEVAEDFQAGVVAPAMIETAVSAESSAVAEPGSHEPSKALGESELSPAAIDAIAQRVIERMSEKVVREIAWEVVPELSELMIRKKLDH
jgi:twitching motility two-component system response regulator PilG